LTARDVWPTGSPRFSENVPSVPVPRQKARVSIQDAMRRAGLDEAKIAERLAALVDSRSEDISLRATREAAEVLGLYPEPGSVKPSEQVTVLFDINVFPDGSQPPNK
jgi:hypothetical protein